jgi:hypothetical protein
LTWHWWSWAFKGLSEQYPRLFEIADRNFCRSIQGADGNYRKSRERCEITFFSFVWKSDDRKFFPCSLRFWLARFSGEGDGDNCEVHNCDSQQCTQQIASLTEFYNVK